MAPHGFGQHRLGLRGDTGPESELLGQLLEAGAEPGEVIGRFLLFLLEALDIGLHADPLLVEQGRALGQQLERGDGLCQLRFRLGDLLAQPGQRRLPLRHTEMVGLHFIRKARDRNGLGAFTQGEPAQDPVGFFALVEHRPIIVDEDSELETPDFLPERLKLFGRPRLSLQGRQLAPHLINNVADA